MAKFICNTDEVFNRGKDICEAANSIKASINNYSKSSDSALTDWSGVAKKSFQTANSSQVSVAVGDTEYMDALGQFVQKSAKAIDDLESELSKLKI